jgi:hypothetical protein
VKCCVMATRGGGGSRRRGRQPGPLPLARERIVAGRCPSRRCPAPGRSPHSAVTHRRSCAPRAGPGRSARAGCADCRMKGPSDGAGTPRIVRAGPSSVKGTRRSFLKPLRGNDLQDPPLSAGDLCQPSGPDGEGQARGQARNAHGEPRRGNIGSALITDFHA